MLPNWTRRTGPLFTMAGVCCVVAACQDTSSPTKQFAPGAILAVSPSDPSATAVIRLIVEGNVPAGSTPTDTAGASSSGDFDRVQGAGITVYRETRDSVPGAPTNVSDTFIGTATTDVNGMVELHDVPAAYFRVDVAPPATSRYAPASVGTVSLPGASTTSVRINLFPKS